MAGSDLEKVEDKDFDKIMEEIARNFEKAREGMMKNAVLFARLSKPQLDKAAQRLRSLISRDGIERLVLLGRGKIAWHLANPSRKILPASVLRRMPKAALDVLNKADSAVEILTPKGVKVKAVSDCNPAEISQVFDAEEGQIPPSKQYKRMLAPVVVKKAKPNLPVDEFESLRVEDGVVIIYGRPKDQSGTRTSAICVPLKELKRLVS